MDDPKGPGFPIQKSTDQSLFASSLWLIAGYNVFHRLSMPRHPPYALSSFITPTCNRRTGGVSVSRVGTITNDPAKALLHTSGGMRFAMSVAGQAPQNACTRCYYNSATPKTSIHLSKNTVDSPRLVDVFPRLRAGRLGRTCCPARSGSGSLAVRFGLSSRGLSQRNHPEEGRL